MTLLLTPTYNTTGILLSHDPPSRHCYRHGAGGELSDDGLTERFYTPIHPLTLSPTGPPAEEVSGGDLEDMEENCNEGSFDLPDPPKPEVGAYHQPCSLHRRQVVLRDQILVVFGNLSYFLETMEILTSSGERVTSYLTATPPIQPDLPSSEQLQNSWTESLIFSFSGAATRSTCIGS